MPQAKKTEKKQETVEEFVTRMNRPMPKLNGNKRPAAPKKRRAR